MKVRPVAKVYVAVTTACTMGLLTTSGSAQDRTVLFDTSSAGVTKSIPTWGLDLAWLNADNVRRGTIFMGQPQVDVIRFSFTGDTPLVSGTLSGSGLTEFNNRMGIVNGYADSHTAFYLNNDTDSYDASYIGTDGRIEPVAWSKLINATRQKCVDAGRTVVSVAPYNEPDNSFPEGSMSRLGDVCYQIRNAFGSSFTGIRLYGGSTLNDDNAASWYNTLNGWGYLEEGCTHQLAGSFDNFAGFMQNVVSNGDVAANDELHNVMEAIVGAEYGMTTGIWWGTAEYTRGEFVKASDGKRLGYAEHRPNWTAASVYRAPDGKVLGFVGESERQSLPTTYRFFSKDRPVFYDGHGPQRSYSVTTTGDSTYGSSAHRDAEKMVKITWGDDPQPAIDGRYYLVNRNSGKVMEVAGGSSSDGANIQQNTFNGQTYQQWDFNPTPATLGGDYSYFTVTAAHSGKAADVNNYSYDDGGNVQQYTSGSSSNQLWFLEYVADGWFYIRNRWSGKYLDVSGGSIADGANIFQWTGNGGLNQQWRLIPVGAAVEFTPPAVPTGLTATANAVSVTLAWNPVAAGDLAGYNVLRSKTAGGPYDTIARGVVATSYVDGSANQTTPYYYVVRAVDRSLNRSVLSAQASATPTGTPAVAAQYAFNGNVADGSGNANDAEVVGTATYGAGRSGTTALVFDGTTNHVNLPAEIADRDAITVAGWVYWNGGGDWQRIFDFGNGTSQYLYLSPRAGGGGMRFAITSGSGEQQVNYASDLPVGQWTHVALTLGGNTGRLYLNGTQVSSASVTIKPSDFKPVLNYLGASQFVADPFFSGKLDDFRIYNYALTAGAITALANGTSTPPDFLAYLKLDETTGSTASDATGDGWDAGLVNSPTWVSGKFNNAVSLAASSSQYLVLPSGIVSGVTDFTVSGWVKITTNATWSRFFDFGNTLNPTATTGGYMMLSTSNGSVPRFAITVSGYNNEQGINGSAALPTGAWVHLAVTQSGNTGRLYVNGAQVGINSALTLNPSSLGFTSNNFLGRSQFSGDPYLNGALDDFRIYTRALSASEIATIASGPPSAPANLSASPGPLQIQLSWVQAANVTYTVKYATVSGGPYTSLVSGLTSASYLHSGLSYGATYYYVVDASNIAGATSSVQTSATPQSALVTSQELKTTVVTVTVNNDGSSNSTLNVQPSVVGHIYKVQFTDDLTKAWSDIGTPQSGTGGNLTVNFPAEPSALRGFYRVVITRQ